MIEKDAETSFVEFDVEPDEYETSDCLEWKEIDEYRFREYEESIDELWAQGWISVGEELKREDKSPFDDGTRSFETRYRLADFRLSKSFRRVINRNRDLKTVIRPLRLTAQKLKLHEAHDKRFYEKLSVLGRLENKYYATGFELPVIKELCVFDDEKLITCSIFQEGAYSIMSDRAFWDLLQPKRSLGIYTALLEMQYGISRGKKFYYLGHYYLGSWFMDYKLRFPGLEFYDWDNDRWIDAKTPEAHQLLRQELTCLRDRYAMSFYFDLFEIVFEKEPDVLGLAVFGKYANGEADPESYEDALDVDAIVLTTDLSKYEDPQCYRSIRFLSNLRRVRLEKHPDRRILRGFYKNGLKFSFHLVAPEWADAETCEEARRMAKDGLIIVFDKEQRLENLQQTALKLSF